MAKSLRSKWKRKMKVIKRVRYGEKELKQLKTILDAAEKKDVDMSDICEVKTKETLTATTTTTTTTLTETTEKMETDVAGTSFHPVKLTNKHGNYPVWMNQRAIRKHKANMKRFGKRKGMKNKKRLRL